MLVKELINFEIFISKIKISQNFQKYSSFFHNFFNKNFSISKINFILCRSHLGAMVFVVKMLHSSDELRMMWNIGTLWRILWMSIHHSNFCLLTLRQIVPFLLYIWNILNTWAKFRSCVPSLHLRIMSETWKPISYHFSPYQSIKNKILYIYIYVCVCVCVCVCGGKNMYYLQI